MCAGCSAERNTARRIGGSCVKSPSVTGQSRCGQLLQSLYFQALSCSPAYFWYVLVGFFAVVGSSLPAETTRSLTASTVGLRCGHKPRYAVTNTGRIAVNIVSHFWKKKLKTGHQKSKRKRGGAFGEFLSGVVQSLVGNVRRGFVNKFLDFILHPPSEHANSPLEEKRAGE